MPSMRGSPATPGALEGMRIGVIRESMVYPTGSKTEEPIVTAAAKEIKSVLGEASSARRWSSRPIRCGSAIPTSSR